MPNFDSNDPREFGWQRAFRGFVPFVYRGFQFPQGVHPLAAPWFTTALDRLMTAGLVLPPLSMGLSAGMWGQQSREVTGGGTLSFHWFGLAIDVAAPWNPYGAAVPEASPHRMPVNTSDLIADLGMLWGGSPRWGQHRDWMHIELHRSPQECGSLPVPVVGAGHLFPLPGGCYYGPFEGPTESISGAGSHDARYRPGLAIAQGRLGVAQDGLYGPVTALAVRTWQMRHSLAVDGLIGPVTWASLVGR